MSGQFNMNYDTEKKLGESRGGGGAYIPELYRALPFGDGQTAINKILVLLFNPDRWGLFNPTLEKAQKYGLAYNNGGLVCVTPELFSFFFQLPSHGIENFRRPDGSEGFTYVLCPKKFNAYLTGHNYQPLFLDDSCAYCDEEQRYWDMFNDRFLDLGYDREARKKLGDKQYKALVEGDEILKKSRQAAWDHRASDRFVLSIFDHAKFIGERKLEETQTAVQHQVWIAPKTVFKGTQLVYDAGVSFFETQGVTEMPVLSLSKDNSRGRKRSEYAVTYTGEKFAYPEDWMTYLRDMSARVDPSAYVHMATRDEMIYYLEGTAPQQAAPPAHQPAPQGAPPAQQTAPPAQQPATQQAAPPQAGPPQAQAAPPAQQAPPSNSPVPPQAAPPRPAAPAPPSSPMPNVPSGPAPAGRPPGAPPAQQPAPPQTAPHGGAPPGPPQGPPPGPPSQAGSPQAQGAPPGAPPAQQGIPDRAAPPGAPSPGQRRW